MQYAGATSGTLHAVEPTGAGEVIQHGGGGVFNYATAAGIPATHREFQDTISAERRPPDVVAALEGLVVDGATLPPTADGAVEAWPTEVVAAGQRGNRLGHQSTDAAHSARRKRVHECRGPPIETGTEAEYCVNVTGRSHGSTYSCDTQSRTTGTGITIVLSSRHYSIAI